MRRLSRRDFLKLGSALSGALALSGLAPQLSLSGSGSAPAVPNILIFVFDAMSAKNLSLYGYPRNTTPNLERLAARATVYNRHYSAGSFTTPGTASLLTGLYPWTHRAINVAGLIARDQVGHNLFRALGNEVHRLAFSQNPWPNYFFGQFQGDIEKILSPAAFSLIDQVVSGKLGRDEVNSRRAFDDFLFQDGYPPASLVFGLAQSMQLYEVVAHTSSQEYSTLLPHTENDPVYFKLTDVFRGLAATVAGLKPPALAYLHLWPPHQPYVPSKGFESFFLDRYIPKPKPVHALVGSDAPSQTRLNRFRRTYDQYIADLDAEFGKLLDFLDGRGILDQSYVVVTSDHGEFFERGLQGHITPLLYDPVVRVPLLISSPGQTRRQDVDIPTSSVDVLPTLVHLSGREVPSWSEGQLLPALGGGGDPQRSLFMMDAKQNSAFAPLSKASFAIRKGPHKLICYRGFAQYANRDKFELYDLESDPEETNDLYSRTSPIAVALRAELLAKINEQDAKFRRPN